MKGTPSLGPCPRTQVILATDIWLGLIVDLVPSLRSSASSYRRWWKGWIDTACARNLVSCPNVWCLPHWGSQTQHPIPPSLQPVAFRSAWGGWKWRDICAVCERGKPQQATRWLQSGSWLEKENEIWSQLTHSEITLGLQKNQTKKGNPILARGCPRENLKSTTSSFVRMILFSKNRWITQT